jgi:hypothetical protein
LPVCKITKKEVLAEHACVVLIAAIEAQIAPGQERRVGLAAA